MTDVATAAYAALDAGLCPIPPREDGSKRPIGTWKQYQSRRPTDEEMFTWYDEGGASGLGTVTGRVAGNLEMLEAEGRAVADGIYASFVNRCEQVGLGSVLARIVDGYCERTPGGGLHLLYRCDEIAGNTKLARLPEEVDLDTGDKVVPVLFETRGSRGFTVLAPSNGGVHPNGGAWELERGGFDTIAVITPEERRLLWEVARSFNQYRQDEQAPSDQPKQSGQSKLSNDSDGPGVADDYAAQASWDDILVDWTYLFTASDGNKFWRRPGKKTPGWSATIADNGDGPLYMFSTSTVFDAERAYSKFQAYAILHHDGDLSAVAKELYRQGYGDHSKGKRAGREQDEQEVQDAHDGEEEHRSLAGPTHLPDDFWESRQRLGYIRQAAHSRQRSADAVLHAVLARIAASIPYTIRLPAVVGSPAPLCYFTVILGAPGVGKGNANSIAAELVPTASVPLGTGEGIVEILFEFVEEVDDQGKTIKVKRQVHHNALIYADEGEILAALGGRNGATLLQTLRSIWSGNLLGNTNASQERRRIVPAGEYAYGVIVGLQDIKAGPLLDDAGAGTPQRFAWCRAMDPSVPDELPGWPGELCWRPPQVGMVKTWLEVAPAVTADIRARDLARTRGEVRVDELQAHSDLMRLKMAGLLAIFDDRLDIGAEDWALAAMLKDTSDATMAYAGEVVAREAQDRERQTSARLARRHVEATAQSEGWWTIETAKRIAAKVRQQPGILVTEVRRTISAKWRPYFDDGLDHAKADGWVIERSEPSHTGSNKRMLFPGEKR